jgi:Leucine Rich repeat
LSNYLEDYTAVFANSSIRCLNLSNNCIVGQSGRKLKGLTALVRKFLAPKGEAFVCRLNSLYSPAIQTIADCLGIRSKMTYLDVSDNFAGLDPYGNPNDMGVGILAQQLSQSLYMRVLKIARNNLSDEEIILICDAIGAMPQFQVLDISGNFCHDRGCEALKRALVNHSVYDEPQQGLVDINISHNPIGPEGLAEICEGIRRTETLKRLDLSHCGIDGSVAPLLNRAVEVNCTIVQLLLDGNPMTDLMAARVHAEVEAQVHIVRLKTDESAPETFDAGQLTMAVSLSFENQNSKLEVCCFGLYCHVCNILIIMQVFAATARKLRFLPSDILSRLHSNPSFNEVRCTCNPEGSFGADKTDVTIQTSFFLYNNSLRARCRSRCIFSNHRPVKRCWARYVYSVARVYLRTHHTLIAVKQRLHGHDPHWSV